MLSLVGKTKVHYTVTDATGRTPCMHIHVWIQNLNGPNFSPHCSPATSVTATTGDYVCEAVVTVPAPAINNPCNEEYTITNDSPYKTSDTDASGTYPVGTTTFNWTITDASGTEYFC